MAILPHKFYTHEKENVIMNKKQKSLNNKGFSLVELIIVIAIMAVLVGVLAPQYLGYVNKSRISTDIQNAQQIATAAQVNYADQEAAGGTYTQPTIAALMGADVVSKVTGSADFAFSVSGSDITVTCDGDELYPTTPDQRGDSSSAWYTLN